MNLHADAAQRLAIYRGLEARNRIVGILRNSIFDYAAQHLTANGPASIDYEDGTELEAESLTYDAVALVWTFTRATVTLPDTPGAGEPVTETP